ncbi:MAG TPA: FixH family protein, partial [Gammaproteobacteria bacterium]|nr:FixH family protein [Gammaproteobacteria bacterium]
MKQPVSTLLISAVSLLIGAGLGALWSSGASGPAAQSATGAPAYRAGPFQLSVRVAPEIPQVGENTLTVELTDLGGEPVRDARLGVVATMRAMGAMPEMRAPATLTETAPGRYSGALTLPMDGSWPLTIDVMKEGLGTSSLRLDMATRRVG